MSMATIVGFWSLSVFLLSIAEVCRADVARTLTNYEKDLADLVGGKAAPAAPLPLRGPAQKGFLDLMSSKRAQQEEATRQLKELESRAAALRSEVAALEEDCAAYRQALERERLIAQRQDLQLAQLKQELKHE